jgi:hypothetical protein
MSSVRSVLGPRIGARVSVRARWRCTVVLALLALSVLALSGAIDSLQSGALTMAPALALALLMLTRPYLGERVIARLRCARPRRMRVASSKAGRALPGAYVARGGRLIAAALAGRAPPLALAGCR